MSAGNPITVLHFVAATQDRGGILTVVRALAERSGVRAVTWVATGFSQVRWPILRLLRRATLPAEEINARTLSLAAREAWRLRFALGEKRRVFHGHSRAGLLVGLWLWLLGCDRVLVTVHNHGRHRWFYRLASLMLGDRLVWLTPAMKRHYDVGTGGWRGCQPNFLPSMNAVRVPKISSARLRLGGIGSLVAWKQWNRVIEALARLSPEERRQVEFQHVGSAEVSAESQAHARKLRAEAAEMGLVNEMVWRGEESSSANLLQAVDVLVLPAADEPFGLGVLEAWQAGIPVLVVSGSGAAEVVTQGVNGWIFEANSPSALAEKISWLLKTRADRQMMPELPASVTIVTAWSQRYAALVGDDINSI